MANKFFCPKLKRAFFNDVKRLESACRKGKMREKMRNAVYQIENEDKILSSAFTYLVQHGLENITIRELCKGTGIAQGSIYYWFGGKDNLICEAAEHGLQQVADKIYGYVVSGMQNLRKFFDNCLAEISLYRKELRFLYQVASSPVYGEKMRSKSKDLDCIYEKYSKSLSGVLHCTQQALEPLVYLFISIVLDYAIWEDEEKSQMQLEFLYNALTESGKTA